MEGRALPQLAVEQPIVVPGATNTVPGVVVFARMQDLHQRAKQGYWLYMLVLIGVGLLLALWGWSRGDGLGLALTIIGGLSAALAVVPLKEALERRERNAGLGVLRDDWVAAGPGEAGAARRHELSLFLRRIYRRDEDS